MKKPINRESDHNRLSESVQFTQSLVTMFVNKFEIFYKSQNVPHVHFMDKEGKKVHIFWKLYGLKPKSLIY